MGMTPDQQHIFKDMARLAFWRGMLAGAVLALACLDFVNRWAQRGGFPLLAAPLAELLPSLIGILLGGVLVVGAQEQVLSRQRAAFGYSVAGAASSLRQTALFVFGWFFIGWGSWWVIAVILKLDLAWTFPYPFFAGLLCCGGVIWYLQRQSHR